MNKHPEENQIDSTHNPDQSKKEEHEEEDNFEYVIPQFDQCGSNVQEISDDKQQKKGGDDHTDVEKEGIGKNTPKQMLVKE